MNTDHRYTQIRDNKEKIIILLSTYNGARFIDQQMSSIISQTFAHWQIFARDDGSSDETPQILQRWQNFLGPEKVIISHDNRSLGIQQSFLFLLKNAPNGHLFAFCDQDDIWLPHKLERAYHALSASKDGPSLFCTSQILFNEKLTCFKTINHLKREPSLRNALVQNIVTGATCVINNEARNNILLIRPPPNILHDWWSYAVVSAVGGHIIFDDMSQLLYRQHSENAIGATRSRTMRIQKAFGRGSKHFAECALKLAECLRHHPNLTKEAKILLEDFKKLKNFGLFSRIREIRRLGIYRQEIFDTWMATIWLAIGISQYRDDFN